MKVIQVIPWLHKRSSGLTAFMSDFCRQMNTRTNLELVSLSPVVSDLFQDVDIHPFPPAVPPLSIVGWSYGMYRYLKGQSSQADIIQTHSLWTLPNIYPYFASKRHKAKVIIMPHGTLAPQALRHSSWKKRIMLWAGQRTALRRADLLIATSKEEFNDIRKFGLTNPVAIIPIGINPATPKELRGKDSSKSRPKTIVYLSRIHPIKCVDLLIKAWNRCFLDFPDWILRIAGPLDSEYAKQMLALAKDLGCERITFTGELSGREKEEFLANADCFILPTSSENFGIAIAEALMHELPVITTQGAPWEGLIDKNAGWWIKPNDEDALVFTLREAMSAPINVLQEMGKRGKEWMQAEFSWDTIAQKYIETYGWLLGEAAKPEFIYIE